MASNTEVLLDWAWLVTSGAGFGFIAAAPIGAVNIICIRRTLHYGWLNGFLSGIGAALGDAFFASLVAFGFTSVSDVIKDHQRAFELVGGLVLVGYAVYALLSTPKIRSIEAQGEKVEESTKGAFNASLTTLGLTLLNPATLFLFTAIVAGLSSVVPPGASSYGAAGAFVAAVFAGSTAWWATIAAITYFLHSQIGDRSITVINRVTGFLIGLFGLAVLANSFWGHWVS